MNFVLLFAKRIIEWMDDSTAVFVTFAMHLLHNLVCFLFFALKSLGHYKKYIIIIFRSFQVLSFEYRYWEGAEYLFIVPQLHSH